MRVKKEYKKNLNRNTEVRIEAWEKSKEIFDSLEKRYVADGEMSTKGNKSSQKVEIFKCNIGV